ncbi:MAG: hypothetical protein KDB26_13880 [Microthrixaceae bacterium]|nr:hypothetical protein [Microthrixaceae bacterium]
METRNPTTEVATAPTDKPPAKQAVVTAALAALIGAVIGAVVAAITIVAVNAASRPSLDELSVDDVCALVLQHGGVPENCTTMYRLEVLP